MKNKVIPICIGALWCIALAAGILILRNEYSAYEISKESYNTITSQVVTVQSKSGMPPITVDFKQLAKTNPEVTGWLYCEGTQIQYPVVQTNENETYLDTLFDGTANKAGTLFVDAKNSPGFQDQNTIIYGHNMKDGSMFGTLEQYKEQSFYEDHKIWYLLTPEENYRIELVAGYVTDENSDAYVIQTATKEQREQYLDKSIRNSLFSSGYDLRKIKKTITLSTCSYEYEDARFVLLGNLIKI